MSFKTPFTDAICPTPSPGDAGHASASNGLSIEDGRAGTPGIMKETTLVDVSEGPKAGSTHMGGGGPITEAANKTAKDLA